MTEINKAVFISSNTKVNKCPDPTLPEYAFIGRSNVGKSSLINMLTNNSKLAHTSSYPGKTQHINHFLIDNSWYLVDLPGYGYAKLPKKQQTELSLMIDSYILQRPNIMCLFVLVDSRHEPQQKDLDFMAQLGINKIPFVIVFTKADKISNTKVQQNIAVYSETLNKQWENLPQMFVTSAQTYRGKSEILTFVNEINKVFAQPNKRKPTSNLFT